MAQEALPSTNSTLNIKRVQYPLNRWILFCLPLLHDESSTRFCPVAALETPRFIGGSLTRASCQLWASARKWVGWHECHRWPLRYVRDPALKDGVSGESLRDGAKPEPQHTQQAGGSLEHLL